MENKLIQLSYHVEGYDDPEEITVIKCIGVSTIAQYVTECAEHFFYHWVTDTDEWPFTFKIWKENELLGRFTINAGVEPIFDIEDADV